MFYDVTLPLTKEQFVPEGKPFNGHIGTHFDGMDVEFPLEYTVREGIVFDISKFDPDHEIAVSEIDMDKVKPGMFVAFYSGFIEKEAYGTDTYRKLHPQLSDGLIRALVEKGIAFIGIDFAGVRRGAEHHPADVYCAEHNTFVIENLRGLAPLAGKQPLTIYTLPLSVTGLPAIPCRVVIENQ